MPILPRSTDQPLGQAMAEHLTGTLKSKPLWSHTHTHKPKFQKMELHPKGKQWTGAGHNQVKTAHSATDVHWMIWDWSLLLTFHKL